MEKPLGNHLLQTNLFQGIEEGNIPHAQLFTGPIGVGQLITAIHYAQQVLALNNPTAIEKVNQLQHADLHFSFPIVKTDAKKTTSEDFLPQFRQFIQTTPYGSVYDWLKSIEVENKQGVIGVDEAERIVKKLSLKSYEGGYKILIIWGLDYMNTAASNKLLKIIEEPPTKTLFILIAENEEKVLQTIRSRTQIAQFKRLTDDEIIHQLIQNKSLPTDRAQFIAHQAQGNYHEALTIASHTLDNESDPFEEYFVNWIRYAFMAKTNPQVLQHLVHWANDIQSWGREKQKHFLAYAIEIFRQALLTHYQINDLQFIELKVNQFNWGKFAPFIHGQNIEDILNDLNEAYNHIERNANPKIIFLDTSIKITRYLHRKPTD